MSIVLWLLPYGFVALLLLDFVVAKPRSSSVIGLLVCGWAILTTSDAGLKAVLSIGGVSLYPADLCVGMLAGLLLTRYRSLKRFPLASVALGIVAVVLVVSLVLGMSAYGDSSALNEMRPFVYAIVATLWALTVDWEDERVQLLFVHWCGALCFFLTIVCAINVFRNGGFASSAEFYLDSQGNYRTLRPLVAAQAMTLALASIVCLYCALKTRAWWLFFSSAVGMIGVIIAQHRSVWAAALTGIVLVILTAGRLRSRLLIPFVVGVGISSIVLVSGLADPLIHATRLSIEAALESESTLADREAGWSGLVADLVNSQSVNLFFGFPMGHGYARPGPRGGIWTITPHNWYVQLLLRCGVVGLSAYVCLLVAAFYRSITTRAVLASALLGTLLVFQWVYALEWYFAVFLGLSIALAASRVATPSEGEFARVRG